MRTQLVLAKADGSATYGIFSTTDTVNLPNLGDRFGVPNPIAGPAGAGRQDLLISARTFIYGTDAAGVDFVTVLLATEDAIQ